MTTPASPLRARAGQVFFVSLPGTPQRAATWELVEPRGGIEPGGEVELLGRSWSPRTDDGPVRPFWDSGPDDSGSWDFELLAVRSGDVSLRFRRGDGVGTLQEHLITVVVGNT